jgi:branched-chain amino acid transport system ATP-binding protein
MSEYIIEGQSCTKKFGGMTAVDSVNFHLNEGEILGLIGPNGAGKSTLFNLISGYFKSDGGVITFEGKKISGLNPDKICHLGLARTFQAAKNFPAMSVYENVHMGTLFGNRGESHKQAEQDTNEIIEFVGLGKYLGMSVPDIPLAGQKQIEVARALATKPKVLLLDELMAGLNPTETAEIMELIRKIRGSGITVLLIEHVMKVIMNICDRIIVLHHGQLIAEGTPKEIAENKQVIEVYLGGEA